MTSKVQLFPNREKIFSGRGMHSCCRREVAGGKRSTAAGRIHGGGFGAVLFPYAVSVLIIQGVEDAGYEGFSAGQLFIPAHDLVDGLVFVHIGIDAGVGHLFDDDGIVSAGIDHDQRLAETLSEFGNGLLKVGGEIILERAGDDEIEGGIGPCFCGQCREYIFGIFDTGSCVDRSENFLKSKGDEW